MSPDSALRNLPSVDAVLAGAEGAGLLNRYSRTAVTDAVRAVLREARRTLRSNGAGTSTVPEIETILAAVTEHLRAAERPSLRRVINATGVVLHTNLGRAALPDAAVAALTEAARWPVNLEYDVELGRRGERDQHTEADLCALTGAEAATVVNNNAAAVLLALNTLAEGREVVVSRGELIEIGGSFRLPDIMAKSQVTLREVGTTNRTHAHDYAAAIGAQSALLLKVHTSNYRVVGFASEVTLADLVAIGHPRGLPVIEDLGSGALVDLTRWGLPAEPVVAERVRQGADVVTFSGDKLLGGPQCGLIVGRRDLIARMNGNPLKRVLRCDKLTLAALSATLRLYRYDVHLAVTLPVLRLLTRPFEEIEALAAEACTHLHRALGPEYHVEVLSSETEIGSGSVPTETLPTRVIAVTHATVGAHRIAERFRRADPPIIGRVQESRFLLDVRCIDRATDLVPQPSLPERP
jgi:L-seryl-tRNA(Ser) seleniumtransferase